MESEPRRVRRLPPELANQIAAGEVVERPASVVKELVENSLDAGADEILIEAEEGGIRLLRVRDNGRGIHRDDLALALSRHATSKVHSVRDLLGITSLGFRGEALASIASIARLRLVSRTCSDSTAWTVGGEAEVPAPAAHPAGTTVEVRDLFYNVPARRKFLRAERTEYEHLEQVVRRLALGNFAAGFTLRHDGRTVFNLAAAADTAAQERRLSAFAGRPFLEHAVALDFAAAGLRLHGWIGARGYSRSQADVQYVYLNGRTVRDRVLAHALRQSFNGLIDDGRFPAYVLYLEMDPAQVDVNVHPTKHEVRFREARLVHDFLVSALRGALGEAQQWSPPTGDAASGVNLPTKPDLSAQVADGRGAYEALGRLAGEPQIPQVSDPPVLGLIAERFLITHGERGLVVVDGLRLVQQEAHRALEQARAQGTLRPRPLLIPVLVRVGAQAATQAEVHGARLQQWGLDLHPVSADAVRLHAVPDVAVGFDAQRLVLAVLAASASDDASLLHALSEAAALPKAERERVAMLARAAGSGCQVEFGPERLAQLVREGK